LLELLLGKGCEFYVSKQDKPKRILVDLKLSEMLKWTRKWFLEKINYSETKLTLQADKDSRAFSPP